MRLYLDDNTKAHQLAAILRNRGHEVVMPADANLDGASDPKHLAYAISADLLVVTCDDKDFTDLHELVLACLGAHPGILLVCRESNPKRNLTYRGIATAIDKLEASGTTLANNLHILNQWR